MDIPTEIQLPSACLVSLHTPARTQEDTLHIPAYEHPDKRACKITHIHTYLHPYTHSCIHACTDEASTGINRDACAQTHRRTEAQAHYSTPSMRHAQNHNVVPWSQAHSTHAYIGWHYLSNATCLMRPRVFSTALCV